MKEKSPKLFPHAWIHFIRRQKKRPGNITFRRKVLENKE
jgi:hypothetical protein